MKKFFLGLVVLFMAALGVLACFDSDPDSLLENDTTIIYGGGGSTIDVYTRVPVGFIEGDFLKTFLLPSAMEEKLQTIVPAGAMKTAFPLTLRVSFSGFVDAQGEQVTEPVTRMCLLYYATSGQWTVLKEVVSPEYEVVSTADQPRALFGRYSIPSPLGYADGEFIPVLLYFETENYASFDLDELLALKNYPGAPNFVAGANVLAVVVMDNSKPL